jgi:hypothetical protein
MKKLYLVGMLAVFVAFATLGFQCQKVTDPASDATSGYHSAEYAPPFSASDFDNAETCKEACNEYYSDMLDDEGYRHSEVMDGLTGGSDDVQELRRQEILLHKDNVKYIQDARKQCWRDCHDQGGLSGGF